ncbi:hypothetical protein ATCC90586_010914 [Pythium insidiosum]|nr:hypothetical protein ATCC90586_010914 [Pythium insidiosum]
MEGSSTGRQRVVLHASSRAPQRSARRRLHDAKAAASAVPQWFDLPLLLPEADVVLAKIQRNCLELADARRDEDDRCSST